MPTIEIRRNVTFEIIECCNCGVLFGMTDDLNSNRLKTKALFYCPNGHPQSYTESEADRLKAQLVKAAKRAEMAETRAREYRDSRDAAYRSQSAMRGVLTRTKNRIAKGVCPCCNRTFLDLHRHMSNKHPDYETANDVAEETT